MQRPLYFPNKGKTLAGTLHLPPGRAPAPAVALFHGFAGQKTGSFFILVELSRRLASEGIASLRFDFRGSGESEGEFEKMTVLDEVSDGRAALRRLRSMGRIDPKRLGVVGISLGGLVAAEVAAREPSLKSVVLWSALARPGKVLARKVSKHDLDVLDGTGRLDIGGLHIGRRFMDTLAGLDPPEALAKSKAPVLIIHGTDDTVIPHVNSSDFLRAAKGRGIRTERYSVKGADHRFSSVPWRRTVIDRTVDWLKDTLEV